MRASGAVFLVIPCGGFLIALGQLIISGALLANKNEQSFPAPLPLPITPKRVDVDGQ